MDSIVGVMEGPIVQDKEAADELKKIKSKIQPVQDSYQPRTIPKGKLIVSAENLLKVNYRP